MSFKRKNGTGSVFQKGERWRVCGPSVKGVKECVPGSFPSKREALRALDAWVAKQQQSQEAAT